jgi:ketosteroid isomerase-like protein
MSQENVDLVREAYAAISARDFGRLAKVTDPEWVFDFSRSISPLKGVYRGHEEFVRFLSTGAEAFERFQLSPVEFRVGSGGEIVVRHHLRAKGRGSGLEWEEDLGTTTVWEVRDGKVVRATMYPRRRDALEAVGLRE